MVKNTKQYNLEEKTAVFAEKTICLLKTIKINSFNKRIIEQLVGSSGSIGANYMEAVESESKKDFIHKITIAKKEAKETQHWLRLLASTNPEFKNSIRDLWKINRELVLIFAAIVRSSKKRKLEY